MTTAYFLKMLTAICLSINIFNIIKLCYLLTGNSWITKSVVLLDSTYLTHAKWNNRTVNIGTVYSRLQSSSKLKVQLSHGF